MAGVLLAVAGIALFFVLRRRMRGAIETERREKERYRRLLMHGGGANRSRECTEVRSEQDRIFIGKATGIVRANFDNPAFNMDMFASEMGMGRNKFYTSMKSVSGMTPNEFTMVAKLRESAELLHTHLHLNIAEVADRFGFSSTKHFSKCFKSFYGVCPSQWRKESTEEEQGV